jgi:putative flippase GtrA
LTKRALESLESSDRSVPVNLGARVAPARSVRETESRPAGTLTLLRSALAGVAATGADLATLSLLVAVAHWHPREANVPALLVGGLVNFLANREYAFRARRGNVAKQAMGYTVVEGVALALNGALYDVVLRWVPHTDHFFWLVRLATTNLVFLGWSYPLWRRVFRVSAAHPP